MLTIATSTLRWMEIKEEEEEKKRGQLDATKLKAASIKSEPPDQQATTASTAGDIAGSASTGRSYECIFCRGGFSTAQGLGGHMNIHRRDRARAAKGTNASSSSTRRGSTEDGPEASYRHYHPYSLHRRLSSSFSSPAPVFSEHPPNKSNLSPDQCSTDTASRSYNTEGRSSVEEDPSVVMRPREQSLFGVEELHLGLGLHRDGDHHDGECVKVGDDQEKELDLELRLGHGPDDHITSG